LPWQPEDWDCWPRQVPATPDGPPVVIQTVQEILRRIPDCEHKTLVDLGGGLEAQLPLLTAAFQRVIVVVPTSARLSRVHEKCEGLPVELRHRELHRLESLRESCDIALALGTIGGGRLCDLDHVLEQIRQSLVEGGLLLGSLGAVPRRSRAYRVRLRNDNDNDEPSRSHSLAEPPCSRRCFACRSDTRGHRTPSSSLSAAEHGAAVDVEDLAVDERREVAGQE